GSPARGTPRCSNSRRRRPGLCPIFCGTEATLRHIGSSEFPTHFYARLLRRLCACSDRNAMLDQMTGRLLSQRTIETAIDTILNDVVALHGAEYGDLQLAVGDELVIVAQRGLSAPFLQAFSRVKKESGCACGRAWRLGRTVVVTDVDRDPEYAAFRKDARA